MTDITVHWPDERNEQGRPMLWFGSWLVGGQGGEAGWFHSGRGAATTQAVVPPEATGVRIRRWPNDGLDAEYADILELAELRELRAAELDFDRRQRYSRLPEDFG